ncbi:MAG: DNA polymerase domain-containing protein [Polyangiales bacterium]
MWAEPDGRALIWRRLPDTGALVRESARFHPWLVLAHRGDLRSASASITCDELDGPGALRFLVRGDDMRALSAEVLRGASARLGRRVATLRELGDDVIALPPEEQYLVATGRTYFRGLGFDDLRRTQVDLETTGLDPSRDRVFLVALRGPDGQSEVLEADAQGDAGEAALLQALVARIQALDPDVIENHNLHGFDLPFLVERARRLGVPFGIARTGVSPSLRPSARGARLGGEDARQALRRTRYTVPGRELIDTMDAVRRHDFAARDLPGHGLKAVARHFGFAAEQRVYIPGAEIHAHYQRDPQLVRTYAAQDVEEAGALARVLGGAPFALARMAPRRYERLADAGPATGVLDPLLVRAYLRAGAALPAHERGDGTEHSGAALHLFASGVAHRIVKADVASLYPSLMRTYRIGPKRDRLGVLLTLVDRLVALRLEAKRAMRSAPTHSAERHTHEAMSAAMKIVVNSAYGYLGAGGLTRFSDVHAANEVTRHGRELLGFLCKELARRGVTLLEADTDGVYFAVPDSFDEAAERKVVDEVDRLLPELVRLEFDGRYAAMLSHEPKNYALLPYGDGPLLLRGVAFRSRRAEPFGQAFLRSALGRLLVGDVAGVRAVYLETHDAIVRRKVSTHDVTALVRLSKTPEEYHGTRLLRRELSYEAMLQSGRTRWSVGEQVRVYRARGGRAALFAPEREEQEGEADARRADPRDYDVAYYLRLLRDTFASRLARALTPLDYEAVVADPAQLSLFARSLEEARPILTVLDG